MQRFVNFLLIGLLMACQQYANAQKTPIFEAFLYFEDAIGNKDTLVIGYDTASQNDRIYPEFGEVWINTPLDSIFEVRAFHVDDFSQKMSKKIIGGCEKTGGAPCYGSAGARIVVSAKHPPIKIRYDSTQFGIGSCQEHAIISPDYLMYFIENWWEADLYYCMCSTSTITYDLNFQGQKFEVEAEVEGKGTMTLPGLFWVLRFWGPCPNLLSSPFPSQPPSLQLSISPNPITECAELQFSVERSGTVRMGLFDLLGKMVQMRTVSATSGTNTLDMDLQGLSAGAYVVRLTNGRSLGSVKLIKQ